MPINDVSASLRSSPVDGTPQATDDGRKAWLSAAQFKATRRTLDPPTPVLRNRGRQYRRLCRAPFASASVPGGTPCQAPVGGLLWRAPFAQGTEAGGPKFWSGRAGIFCTTGPVRPEPDSNGAATEPQHRVRVAAGKPKETSLPRHSSLPRCRSSGTAGIRLGKNCRCL
jgi:hypothetical protein